MGLTDKNLSDVLTAYDTFFIDSHVLSDSSRDGVYPGAETVLSALVRLQKQVIVFDNSSQFPSAHFPARQWQPWAEKGIHFCTSAGLCQNYLLGQGFFSYFLFGSRPLPGMVFAPNMSMAEFIYLDLPAAPLACLRPENLIKLPEFPGLGFAASVEPFMPLLQQARQQGITLFCNNLPPQKLVNIGEREVVSARNLADYYTSIGGNVVAFGKPYLPAYELVLGKYAAAGKILCIGTNPYWEILGADNLRQAGYSAASLLIQTDETANGRENLFLKPDFVFAAFALPE